MTTWAIYIVYLLYSFHGMVQILTPNAIRRHGLGSGLIDQSQKMTAAAMQMAEKKV